METETFQNIDEVIFKVRCIVEDLDYILNDSRSTYKFCGGERELAEGNLRLFKDVQFQLKKAALY